MIYLYEKDGQVKELEYPAFKAPETVGGWQKLKTGMPRVTFNGGVDKGWTRAGEGGSGVSWDDVEKYNAACDELAQKDEQAKIDHLTEYFADSA